MIEGKVEKGQKVVLVEDLISTGGSSLKAAQAMKEAGFNVIGMVAIFTYGLSDAEESFKAANCTLHTLTNYDYLIKKALEQNHIKDSDMQSLIQWRENPRNWGQNK